MTARMIIGSDEAFSLESFIQDLFLCDPQSTQDLHSEFLLCTWDGSAENSEVFTVYSDGPLKIGVQFEAAGSRWEIVAIGNGWIAEPVAS